MIKILSIGNSFSEDAQKYLHSIAESGGVELQNVNLYIGGCSLETHWNNAIFDLAEYDYQVNGASTGEKVSIKTALSRLSPDIVTLQQCSGKSGLPDSYHPYLSELHDYASRLCPKTKFMIHQTWAYDDESDHPEFANYQNDRSAMYSALCQAYDQAARLISAKQIPVGRVIESLRKKPYFNRAEGGASLCRDGYHLDLIYGRYAAATVWYRYVLGGNILNNRFAPDGADPAVIDLIKRVVAEDKARKKYFSV